MGIWGPGPYDNDYAADWLSPVVHQIADHIEEAFAEGDPNEIRVAAWLLGQVAVSAYTYDIDRMDAHFAAAEELLAAVEDEARAEGWEDIAEDIVAQREHLRRVASGEFAAPGLFERIAEKIEKARE